MPLQGTINIDDSNANMSTLLIFNSRFESGNLERAYKIEDVYKVPQISIRKSALCKNPGNPDKKTRSNIYRNNGMSKFVQNDNLQVNDKLEARYELFLSPDYGIGEKFSNKEDESVKYGLSKHTQWFYFSTKNFTKGLKAKFAIKNLYKKNSSYSKGMKPFVFSLRKYKEHGTGWHRGGDMVCYSQNYDNPSRSTLRFTYMYEYDDDIVYFAHYIPYTFTRMK